MAGSGIVSLVSDMGQSPQGVLEKRNRLNARQRRHRWAAPSPVGDMASMRERLRLTMKVHISAHFGSSSREKKVKKS